jgi:hypothetical protein
MQPAPRRLRRDLRRAPGAFRAPQWLAGASRSAGGGRSPLSTAGVLAGPADGDRGAPGGEQHPGRARRCPNRAVATLSPASCAASSRPAPTPPRKDSVTPPPPAAGATPPSWPRPTAADWRRSEAVAIDLADLDLLDLGVDSATVQKMAGHAFASKTERYDRRDRGVQRRAAALLHVPYVAPKE